MTRFTRYLLGLTLSLNQFANAIIGGSPQMTISARLGYARARGGRTSKVACILLDWVDPGDGDKPTGDHCTEAMRRHELRLHIDSCLTEEDLCPRLNDAPEPTDPSRNAK